MPTYTHREMADMHLIYGMAKCNGREALRMYRVKYPGRQLPSRSFLPLCIDDCVKPARSTCTSWILVANEQLGRLMLKTGFSKNWSVILQQVHELYPERPISPKLPSGALHTTKDYILIIYNASKHWKTTTNVWILRGGFCTKVMQTETLQQVFSSRMRLHSH
ncbi:hypothetical protein TNCV_5026201 [Trichonephila clavipes]|uniref:DUF4817 domain-containing protein n=1 Tax=Trichonephila clavipes TaxID=2585209 RepID=A0A8X6RVC4_TRICX|nr:hypothetical protein TNCV_5026201 [Trichonephila clavipes]